VRYISDQVRTELNAEGVLFRNWKAGNEMTAFIRGEGIQAPVLIYTGLKSVHLTRYVNNFQRVGSLSGDYKAFQRYVDALGKRRQDDTDWIKFGGTNMSNK